MLPLDDLIEAIAYRLALGLRPIPTATTPKSAPMTAPKGAKKTISEQGKKAEA